eukprot:27039_1
METKTKKSVHFASQDTEHTIAASYNKPERRFVSIEDETSDPSELHIAEKALKVLQDASKMRIDKQLVKLAKDGVIFLKAPSNTNTQRTNAMKLRTTIIKLLSKYQFVETVPHPKHDTKKSVEENEWIPEHAIKPRKSALKAIFVGSVGKNEPKWRSFWEWSDDSTENVAPESQSSYSSSPPPPITMPDDTKDLTFEQLSDDDKRTIYEWAVKREGTQFFKQRAAEVFESYAANESALDWEIKVVDPLWFRIQSAGSMVHTDTPYIARHTNALSKISGQKLMISGIDMTHKATFIGNNVHCVVVRIRMEIMKKNNCKKQKKDSVCVHSVAIRALECLLCGLHWITLIRHLIRDRCCLRWVLTVNTKEFTTQSGVEKQCQMDTQTSHAQIKRITCDGDTQRTYNQAISSYLTSKHCMRRVPPLMAI